MLEAFERLARARGGPIDLSKTPQPQATDADLAAYNGAGDLIQVGRDAWHALPRPSTGTKVLIGGGLLLGLALAVRGATR